MVRALRFVSFRFVCLPFYLHTIFYYFVLPCAHGETSLVFCFFIFSRAALMGNAIAFVMASLSFNILWVKRQFLLPGNDKDGGIASIDIGMID
jgi:hypothetical protein